MERLQVHGAYEIEAINTATGERVTHRTSNIVVQGFYDALFEFLNYSSDSPDADVIDLTQIRLGTGTTAPTRNDTALEAEYFSKDITSKSYTDTTFTARLSIGAPEGNPAGEHIREVAAYAGTRMVSRAIVDIQKNSNIQLVITWRLNTEA